MQTKTSTEKVDTLRLGRVVPFYIEPFGSDETQGAAAEGSPQDGSYLAIFLELSVELIGSISPDTGFIVNITEIDKEVRRHALPIFESHIKQHFRQTQNLSFAQLTDILWACKERLDGRFGNAVIDKLSLKLSKFKEIAISPEDRNMIYYTEKFEFSAMHKLWNENFTAQKNFEVFGKCANPTGHGHNYIIEITAKKTSDPTDFPTAAFQKTIKDNLIELLDHKNLNADVPFFSENIPTIENIAVFSWNKLCGKFEHFRLHCITIRETDKTYCSYFGPSES